ncbi:exoenzymes regulatory protein aepA precursor, putative [Talaromyces stipitatus ATCC 10500]|uniref:Exoenzymes regulatory protein aepA, putative n=1 Tax=Talaromyces stipitatus (strain ATCC 10500 / CBS 375.48 / QM 6759 / NRRL 1006) TaxID=441959 RepID=B8M1T1_TALSN|nr:exoenzymes regulatory protein aepA precursor, putative [Talaromyces stipitatus ATCC 10500]EED21309.1 exoenzymes regulatory protein aepA precursor, putative [Talaromyces stipitatus ATCC 10500]
MGENSGSATIKADILIRAGSIYTLEPRITPKKSLAIKGRFIWALSDDRHGLDNCIGPDTHVLNYPNGTVLPSFDDTHTHLIFAGLSAFDVPVHDASTIDELLYAIRERTQITPAGKWVVTAANFQEHNLREQRLPTLRELDLVSRDHPIVVRRGGHNLVANSYAMNLAGVTPDTKAPGGGHIGLDEEGGLNGLLQDTAVVLMDRIRPSASMEERVEGIRQASASYAATGTGCVRDCAVSLKDLEVLRTTHDAGKLHVRIRALISAIGLTTVSAVDQLLTDMEAYRSLQTDPWLQIWGVKFMLDGGIESAALETPYIAAPPHCCAPAEYIRLTFWDPKELTDAMDAVVCRGWRVGCHAFGDRTVGILLDVYEEILRRHPYLPISTLVLEHGGLVSPEQQKRAIRLKIPVTIQHPLLHDTAGILSHYWGSERVEKLFPARSWLDQGALLAGGSDYPVGSFDAMRSIWGMSSRETVAGTLGVAQAITPAESVSLHTTFAADLLRESDRRGRLLPGYFADLAVWPEDPLRVQDFSKLRDMLPLCTIVGGKSAEDDWRREVFH